MKVREFNLILLILASALTSCDSGPKIIQSETEKASSASAYQANSLPVFDDLSNTITPIKENANSSASDEHKIIVKDVLKTEKYAYLKAEEDGQEYWVAISKADVEIGGTYYFKGGLLKRNFFSREFNRVFGTVYLVSDIWSKEPTQKEAKSATAEFVSLPDGHPTPDLEVGEIKHADGAIRLSELFADKEKYANQIITVTGKCVKVNPMIMNRNWLHIQDGTGKELDLTVTTSEKVPLGAVVSLEGTITLDKDFGAGYRYDLIMEGAVLR